jgi:hypothetical protein
VREKRAKDRLAEEFERIKAEPVAPLSNLEARVRGWLEAHPDETWDAAVRALSRRSDLQDAAERESL